MKNTILIQMVILPCIDNRFAKSESDIGDEKRPKKKAQLNTICKQTTSTYVLIYCLPNVL